MTGGGFGGCIIALVEVGDSNRIGDEITVKFGAAGYGPPTHFTAVPSAGAERLE
jgi:galactokinase